MPYIRILSVYLTSACTNEKQFSYNTHDRVPWIFSFSANSNRSAYHVMNPRVTSMNYISSSQHFIRILWSIISSWPTPIWRIITKKYILKKWIDSLFSLTYLEVMSGSRKIEFLKNEYRCYSIIGQWMKLMHTDIVHFHFEVYFVQKSLLIVHDNHLISLRTGFSQEHKASHKSLNGWTP